MQTPFILYFSQGGAKWDHRFHPVSWDLNKWSSLKTISPHLSLAKGFICLTICNGSESVGLWGDRVRDGEQGMGLERGEVSEGDK